MPITLFSTPTPNPRVANRILEGEAVLVDGTQGKVKVLNAVGARIWALLDGRRTVDQVVDAIVADFDVARPTAETETLQFLNTLFDQDLIAEGA